MELWNGIMEWKYRIMEWKNGFMELRKCGIVDLWNYEKINKDEKNIYINESEKS